MQTTTSNLITESALVIYMEEGIYDFAKLELWEEIVKFDSTGIRVKARRYEIA